MVKSQENKDVLVLTANKPNTQVKPSNGNRIRLPFTAVLYEEYKQKSKFKNQDYNKNIRDIIVLNN